LNRFNLNTLWKCATIPSSFLGFGHRFCDYFYPVQMASFFVRDNPGVIIAKLMLFKIKKGGLGPGFEVNLNFKRRLY